MEGEPIYCLGGSPPVEKGGGGEIIAPLNTQPGPFFRWALLPD